MNLSAGRHYKVCMATRTRSAARLLTLATLAFPAGAQVATSIDTELVKGRCRFIADDGEVGHYALKRCPGLGGAQVYTNANVNNVTLSFKWGRKEAEVFSKGGLGLKLEWRGIKGKQGFKPNAVIVERLVKDYDLANGRMDEHPVWSVIRIEPRNACEIAVVDATANPDALALARSYADTEAPAISCRNAKAKIVGNETRWAKEAIGTDEVPPQ